MDTSRQGWYYSWDPDTRITDLRKIQSSAFSEKPTNRVPYEERNHLVVCTAACFVYINSVETYLNEGWTHVLISTRRKGWLKIVDVL